MDFTWYTLIYAVLGAAIVGVELTGVFSKGKNDTISEHWWALQSRFPRLARVLILSFLVWLGIHLVVKTDQPSETPVVVVETTVVYEDPPVTTAA